MIIDTYEKLEGYCKRELNSCMNETNLFFTLKRLLEVVRKFYIKGVVEINEDE